MDTQTSLQHHQSFPPSPSPQQSQPTSSTTPFKTTLFKLEDKCAPVISKLIPNFIVAHYIYFISWFILASVVVYAERNIPYIDALYIIVSACTQGGLSTIQVNDLKLYQQIVIYVSCFCTTIIFTHGALPFIRLYWYERRFHDIQQTSILNQKSLRENTISMIRSKTASVATTPQTHNAQRELLERFKKFDPDKLDDSEDVEEFVDSDIDTPSVTPRKSKIIKINNNNNNNNPDIKFGNLPKPQRNKTKENIPNAELIHANLSKIENNYLSWNPEVGRNSKFITLTKEQKEELGGVEYQAMKLLSKIVACYYFGFHLLGAILLTAFIENMKNYKIALQNDGVGSAWWAIFSSMSALANFGLSLNVSNMVLFDENAFVLTVSGFLILLGNTAFPIALRFIIWIMRRYFSKPLTMRHNSLSFLLDHPRRCFTLLFPSSPTWWLLVVLFMLNLIDWIFFIILEYKKDAINYLPRGYQIFDGLFQAVSARTAGFNVVNLALLHPALQLGYIVMMYVSVLPLAISIRRTNVYEEQSLGVYNRETETTDQTPQFKYIGTHLRKQLSFDLWFLFLAVFIICICEGDKILKGDTNLGIFPIMFEVTSAYGTVGLSLGYPNMNTSLSGKFNTISKLVIIAVLIRGRHRGLPNSIDRAIMLNTEKLELRDDLETYNALRTHTRASHTINPDVFPELSRAVSRAAQVEDENTATTFKNVTSLLKATLANLLTMRSEPVEKYTREFTQCNN